MNTYYFNMNCFVESRYDIAKACKKQ